MRWMAAYRQVGEGCDYTIACGFHYGIFEAVDYSEAMSKLRAKVRDEYSSEDFKLLEMFIARDPASVDIAIWYQELDDEKASERYEEKRDKELAELQRLQNKYPGGTKE